ncbi:MAG: IclR family transcriptional regulator [Candidatus Cryptobacteroides sp.]|nr:helix-turn-helix domain-containing protein [Bacteroidales bacterium]
MILVLVKALNILDFLGKTPNREIPLGEIAAALNMDRGTCSNIMKTLAAKGFVQQSDPRMGYKLGYMIYSLANSSVNNDELTKIAREDVTKLGDKLNESAILSVIRNDKRVVLFQSRPDREQILTANIDKSVYSANTARVILANYTPPHQEKFIIRNGMPTETQWPELYRSSNPSGELMNELSSIKRKGYAIQEDRHSSTTGFAAPLFRRGHVEGSVGVFIPDSREIDRKAILCEVLDCAREINHKIALIDKIEE